MDKFTIPIKPGGIIHMFTSFHKQWATDWHLGICNGWDYELLDGLTAGMVHWSAVLFLPVQQKTIWINSNTNLSLKSLAFHHMCMSENGLYPQWNSHLVGIIWSAKPLGVGVHYYLNGINSSTTILESPVLARSISASRSYEPHVRPFALGKLWEHDGKMMGQRLENDGEKMGQLWENGGEKIGKWWEKWENDGAIDGEMMGKRLEHDRNMIGTW